MGKIPNNFHIIYGLAENFGWDEYEHYVGEVGKTMKRPKADPFNIIRYLAIKSTYDTNRPDNIFFIINTNHMVNGGIGHNNI